MKYISIVYLMLFLGIGPIIGQHAFERCGHTRLLAQAEESYPGYKASVREAFNQIKKSAQSRTPEVYKIPVVFHVVWNTSNPDQNIPDSCITRQMEILNAHFRARHANRDQIRSVFGLTAEDSEIEFYLADVDPQGNPTDGIVRKQTSSKFAINLLQGINVNMKSNSKGGSDPWPVKKYLNIWVVHMPLNFLGQEQISVIGFSTPPAALPNWPSNALDGVGADGIVMQYHFIGDNNPHFAKLSVEFKSADLGKSLVHEAGHYLGLRHIWADKGNPIFGSASCENLNGDEEDDGMEDTPYCGESSQISGCDPEKNSCDYESPDLPDMWENYMDYSVEQCLALFTPKQIQFMRLVIANYRKDLVSWNNPSGTDNPKKSENYTIIPNPNSGQFSLKSSTGLNPFALEIYDLMGRKVLKLEEGQLNQMDFDLKVIPDGFYLLKIKDLFNPEGRQLTWIKTGL